MIYNRKACVDLGRYQIKTDRGFQWPLKWWIPAAMLDVATLVQPYEIYNRKASIGSGTRLRQIVDLGQPF